MDKKVEEAIPTKSMSEQNKTGQSKNEKHSLHTLSIPSGRLDIVDALRGFALAAIILIHFIEHFSYHVYPANTGTWIDQFQFLAKQSFYLMFAGKAYAIFALLFGFSYWIQYSRRAQKGEDYAGRFAWRLAILLVFGFIDGLFFIGGDILAFYALLGFALIPLRKMKTSILLGISIFLICQPIEIWLMIQGLCTGMPLNPENLCDQYFQAVNRGAASGNWGVFFWESIQFSQLASLGWYIEHGRVSQTLGLFILGFLAGRHGLFIWSEKTQHFWAKCFIFSAIAAWPLWLAYTCVQPISSTTQFMHSSSVLLNMWLNIAITGIIASTFILLYQIPAIHRWSNNLRLYGSMSLTNYVSQSIIGALIFFPIALGLADSLSRASSFIVGLIVLFLQLLFCRWWKKGHSKGPLEAIWAKLTWINK